jgi:hypothetical protein
MSAVAESDQPVNSSDVKNPAFVMEQTLPIDASLSLE